MAKIGGKSKIILIVMIIFLLSIVGIGGGIIIKNNLSNTNSNKETEVVVTFDPNGGQPISIGQGYKVQENGLITKVFSSNGNYGELPIMGKEDYDFLGWYNLASDIGIKIDDYSNLIDTNNHTLYAHYANQILNYTVRYKDINTNIEVLRSESGVAYKGDIVNPEQKSLSGYHIVNDKSDLTKEITQKGTELIIYYEKNEYNIKYVVVVDGIKYTSELVTTFEYGDTVTLTNYDEILSKDSHFAFLGYSFKCWQVGTLQLKNENVVTVSDLALLGFSLDFENDKTDTIELIAQYSQDDYTLTLYNGLNKYNQQTLHYKDKPSFVNAPSKSGYNFVGWFKNNTGATGTDIQGNVEVNLTEFEMGAENVEFYAGYTLINYTLTIDLDDGQFEIEFEKVVLFTIEDNFIVPKAIKEAYNFLGYRDEDDEYHRVKANFTISKRVGDITIKAIYSPKPYKIYLDTDGGVLLSGTNEITYNIESSPIILPDASKNGYEFDGWTGEGIEIATLGLEIGTGNSGDKQFYANYTPISYTIEYNIEDGADEVVNPTTYNIETESFTLNNPTKTGSKFIGWTKGDETLKVVDMEVTKGTIGDLSFTAHFELIEYTVELNLNGGTIEGETLIKFTIESEDITLNDASKLGCIFTGWTNNEITTPTKGVTIEKGSHDNYTFTANYELVEYNITYDYNGGSKVYGDYRSKYTIELDKYTPSGLTKEGYIFSKWELYDENGSLLDGQAILKGSTGDRKFKAIFIANTNTKYTVYHYKENLEGDFELEEFESFTGETDSTIEIDTKTYQGFTSPDKQKLTINPNGESKLDYYYTRNKYKVTIDSKGQIEEIFDKEYKYEEMVSILAVPNTGYTFISWVVLSENITANSLTQKELIFTMPSENVDLTIDTEVVVYKITIDYNDNKTEPKVIEYTYFTETFVINEPTRIGYDFIGYKEGNSDYVSTIVISKNSTGDKTYKAYWEIIKYTITYELNGGVCDKPNKTSFTYETETFSLVNPHKDGYAFIGWSGTDLDGEVINVEIHKNSTGDRTYIANYEPNDIGYKVKYYTMDLNGTSYTEYDTRSFTAKVGETVKGELIKITGFTAPTEQSIELSFVENENEIIYEYTRNKYNLNLAKGDEGVSELVGKGSYFYEEEVNISLTLNNGYDFDKWTGYVESTSIDYTLEMPASDITFTAYTKLHWYKITYNYEGTADKELIESYTITSNSIKVDVTINRTGYKFKGWQGTGLDGVVNTFTINKGSYGDKEYTAVFIKNKYDITYNLNGGSVIEENPSFYYVDSEEITLNNPVKDGYTFTGWSGTGLEGEENKEVVIATGETGDKEFTAHFKADDYTVVFNYNGATVGIDTISKIVTFGTEYGELPIPGKIGYEFVGWYADEDFSVEITSTSVLNISNEEKEVQLYAKYNPKQYKLTLDLQNSQANIEIDVLYNESIQINIETPRKKGHDFKGFYTQRNGKGALWVSAKLEMQKEQYDVNGDTILYAYWEKGTYVLTLDGGEGADEPRTQTRNVMYNAVFPTDVQKPTRTGYVFNGFFLKENGNGQMYYDKDMVSTGKLYSFDTDKTIYAYFTPCNSNITLNRNAVDSESLQEIDEELQYLYISNVGTESAVAIYDADMPTAQAPYIAGKYFKGYYDTKDNTGKQYYAEDMSSVNTWDKIGDTTLYAYYITHYYTVNFDYNVANINPENTVGTTSVDGIIYGYDMPSDNLTAPTRTGYTFLGYYSSDNVKYYEANMTSAHIWDLDIDNVTLIANWQANTYTITYEANGGVEKATLSYKITETTQLGATTKTGYTFSKWKVTTVDGNWEAESEFTSTDTVTGKYGNVTLTAQWVANTNTIYKVRHYLESLTHSSGDGKVEFNEIWYDVTDVENNIGTTDAIITPEVKSYTGFTSPSTQTTTVLPNGSTVVDYYYTRNSYNLTLAKGTGISAVLNNGTSTTSAVSYKYGATVVIDAIVSDGYTWDSWSLTTGTVPSTFTAEPKSQDIAIEAGDVTLTANATAITYTITYMSNGGASKDALSYNITNTTELGSTTRPGYTFMNWRVTTANGNWEAGAEFTSIATVTGKFGNVILTAQWSENPKATYVVRHYQESLIPNIGDGKVQHDGLWYDAPEVENKDDLSEAIIAPEVKSYTGFTSPSTQTTTVSPDGSTVVNYYYTRNSYNLTLVEGTGISEVTNNGTSTTSAVSYKYGATVVIDATISVGYSWDSWSVTTETAPSTFTVDTKSQSIVMGAGDVTLTANATAITYTITYEANGGVEKEALTYKITNTTELGSTTRPGYTFSKWKVTSVGGNWGAEAEFTSTDTVTDKYGNVTLTAQWIENIGATYVVRHYQESLIQNIGDGKVQHDGLWYDVTEVENKDDLSEAIITPEVKSYTGFTSPSKTTTILSGDGSTVVNYYYTRNSYNLTLVEGTGISEVTNNGTSTISAVSYKYGTTVVIDATIIDGYTWDSWTVTTGTAPSTFTGETKLHSIVIEAEDITLTANATEITYTITYVPNGGASKDALSYNITNTTELGSTTRPGYTFMNWRVTTADGNWEAGTEFDSRTTVTGKFGNVILTAQWSENPKAIYLVKHYKELLTPSSGDGKVQHDGLWYDVTEIEEKEDLSEAIITPEVKSYTGFTSPSKTTTILSGDGSTVVNYYYTRNSYNLTLVEGTGISEVTNGVTSTTSAVSYKYGAEVSINAIVSDGYTWDSWSVTTGTAPSTFTVDTKSQSIVMGAGNVTLTANATAITYTITYEANDGTPKDALSYQITNTTEIGATTRTGYTFNKWKVTTAGGNWEAGAEFTSTDTVTGKFGNVTLTAQWKSTPIATYTVRHYQESLTPSSGDGSVQHDGLWYDVTDVEEKEYFSNESISPAVKSYTGFTAPSAQEIIVSADGSTVLDYYYLREIHNVTINIVGNGVASTSGAGAYKYGATVQVSVNIEKGYHFTGWKVVSGTVIPKEGYNMSDVTIQFVLPNDDVVFNVSTSKNVYTITIDHNDGRSNDTYSYTCFDNDFTIEADSRIGYTFAGYSGYGISDKAQTITVYTSWMRDIKYTSNWEIISYNITYDWKLKDGSSEYNFGKSDTEDLPIAYNDSRNPSTYTYGNSVSLYEPTRENFTFIGWKYAGVDVPTKAVTIPSNSIGDKGFTAVFSVNTVKYTVLHVRMNFDGVYNENDVDNVIAEINYADIYSSVTPLIRNDNGFTPEQTTPTTITLSPNENENVVIYKYLRDKYSFTINGDIGIEYFSIDGVRHEKGEEIEYFYLKQFEITPVLKQNYIFKDWTYTSSSHLELLDSTIKTLNITIDGDITLEGSTVKYYTITYDLGNSYDQGTMSGDVIYNYIYTSSGFLYAITDSDLQTTLTNLLTNYTLSQSVVIDNEVIRTGYTWNGWTGTGLSSVTKHIEITSSALGDKEYIANYTAKNYTVTLDKQNGTDETDTVTATYDEVLPTTDINGVNLTAPTKTGYTFGGYFTLVDGNGTQYYTDQMKGSALWKEASDTTLYAKWTIDTYSITFSAGTGIAEIFVNRTPNETTGESSGTYYPYNTYVYVIVKLKDDDAQYKYKSPEDFSASTISGYYYKECRIGTSNISLGQIEANKDTQKYTITITTNNSSYGSVNTTEIENVYYGTQITSSSNTITLNDVHILTNNVSSTVSYNKTVTATSKQITGHTITFSSWINGNVTIQGNTTITANFNIVANTYTISYNLNEGIYGSYHPETATFDVEFTVNNPTRVGHTFGGWSISGMDDVVEHTCGGTSVTGTSASGVTGTSFMNLRSTSGTVTFTANWIADTYTLTLTKNSNIRSIHYYVETVDSNYNERTSSTNEQITAGKTVRLYATPATGYSTTYNSSSNYTTLTMNSAQTWSPTATANTYNISYNLNGGEYGSKHPETATFDVEFTVSNPTKTGYTFTGWNITGMDDVVEHICGGTSVTGTSTSGVTGTSFMNLRSTSGTVTFTASWSPITYDIEYYINYGNYGSDHPTSATFDESFIISNPTRGGYTFDGWYITGMDDVVEHTCGGTSVTGTSASGVTGTQFMNLRSTSGTVCFEAYWSPIVYNISYNLNGGEYGSKHPTSATFNTPFTVSNPTRGGYTFDGWYITGMDDVVEHICGGTRINGTSTSGVTGTSFRNLRSTSDETVYFEAKWTQQANIISYDANGGTGNISSQTKLTDEPIFLSDGTGFTRTGFTLVGWDENSDASTATYALGERYSTDSSLALYAVWWSDTSVFKFVVTKATSPYEVSIAKANNTTPTGDIKLPSFVYGKSASSGSALTTKSYSSDTISGAIKYTVTSIADNAFQNCDKLTGSLTIPNSVKSIGNNAFYLCRGFNDTLTIGDKVTSIGNAAFYGCRFTGSLTIPNSVTSIGNYAFSTCSGFTGSLTIPNSVTSIGNYAFSVCNGFNDTLTIGNNVASIGDNAFRSCSGFIGSLTIPNSVASIGNNAFLKCRGFIGSLTIPNSVNSIGECAFGGCSGLESITVDSDNTTYDSRDDSGNDCNAIIKTSTNELIAGCQNTEIPGTVTKIGNYAFFACSGLTEITIPSSVTSIGNYAFAECSGLINVITENSVTSIGNHAFDECSGLTGTLTIPNSVTSIGYWAFGHCSGLTGIEIPNRVTSIGQCAFGACDGLVSITVDIGNTTYDSRDNCNAIIKTSTKELIAGCKNTKIPDSVKSIGYGAFYECYGLTGNLTFPDSVTSIGDYAFAYCSGLTGTLIIQYLVTSIGESAFEGSGFTSIIINTECETSIGESAFESCINLTTVIIDSGVTSIGYRAFFGCSGLTRIRIPDSVTSIGMFAFCKCTGLSYIQILATTPPTLSYGKENDVYINPFDSTNNCDILVPINSISDYTTEWSSLSNRIWSLVRNEYGELYLVRPKSDGGYYMKEFNPE